MKATLIACVLVVLMAASCIGSWEREDVTYTLSDPIDVNISVLKEFDGAHRKTLLRHLASSANWHLCDWAGTLTAIRRHEENGVIIAGLNWYDSSGDDYASASIRILLERFSPKAHWGGDRPAATVVAADSKPTRIRMKDPLPSLGQPGYVSILAVSGGSITVEVYEQSSDKGRRLTQEAVKLVGAELTALLQNEKELSEKGYVRALIAPESVIESDAAKMKVMELGQRGIYQVEAYVNPAEEGYAYLKVFNSKSNRQLSKRRIFSSSIEHLGWSKNPKEKFFYSSDITVYEGDWSHQYEARFELWFHPRIDGPERILVEMTTMIYGWQR